MPASLGVPFSEQPNVCRGRRHPLMSSSQTALSFPLLPKKPVEVDFTGGNLSSDGGLLLLSQLDRRIGLTERAAACLSEWRLPGRVQHSLLDLLRQRLYQI